MNASDILTAVNAGEDKDWEFKSAKGGVPGSLWETYSAMANTDGGVIVLGVKERGDDFEVQGLEDPDRIQQDFWSTINNRGKASVNLLANSDVRILPVDGKPVLVIDVPRASRRQRPVFVGQNPLEGTFRRYHEGDYRCTPDEVGRMLADKAEEPADSEILEKLSLSDLDKQSLDQYRNRFASRSPTHPWLTSSTQGFLEKLGGWRTDRTVGREGVTVAGLLMFGKDDVLRDPAILPKYQVDYRERLSSDPEVRWTDRIWPDGTWTPNLFQFFERVYPKLVADLKIPFQLVTPEKASLFQRVDDTIVHEAIREAFVNALIHADYRGLGGIVVERYRDRLEFSNPGNLLLGIEQIFRGGVSECRNKALQNMFAMLGYGEKAGSGIDKIRQGWQSQKWRWPVLREFRGPDRIQLVLPMFSLLPEESLTRLRTALGEEFTKLNSREVQALVTADVEVSVTNQRLRQFCTDHPTDVTRSLQDLVSKGLLEKDGYGRWASYRLPGRLSAPGGTAPEVTDQTTENGGDMGASSPHKHTSSPRKTTSSPHSDSPSEDNRLLALAAPAREKARLAPAKMKELIRMLCEGQFLTFTQIGTLLNRNPKGIRDRFLAEMVREGALDARYQDPTHPDQAYRTNPDWKG